jgi:hypothetical protein
MFFVMGRRWTEKGRGVSFVCALFLIGSTQAAEAKASGCEFEKRRERIFDWCGPQLREEGS